MKVYFGREIKEECRGDLAAIVTLRGPEQARSYEVFLYPVTSNEYNQIALEHMRVQSLARLYVGVSVGAGCSLVLHADGASTQHIELTTLDQMVLDPAFENPKLREQEDKMLVGSR